MKSSKSISDIKLHVGINATSLNNRPSGAKSRFLGIYPKLFSTLKRAKFIIYHSKDYEIKNDINPMQNVYFKEGPFISDKILERNIKGLFFWKNEIRSHKFDIFENLHLPTIRNRYGITIQTIHDIRHLNGKTLLLNFYKFIYKNSSKYSDLILTVSEAMKKEIIKKLPNSNVSVIYNGLDISSHEFGIRNNNEQFDGDYILSIGHFEERKNYINLVLAFEKIIQEGFSDNLIIVGNDSGMQKEVFNLINKLKLSKRVLIFSNVDNDKLAALYKDAKFFIFPSKYEGFGIPIIEAFNHSCPVLLSNISVFKEITEERLVYFDPNDISNISSAIKKMLTSEDLRIQSIKYGKERIQDFDNQRLADKLISEYEKILNQKDKMK